MNLPCRGFESSGLDQTERPGHLFARDFQPIPLVCAYSYRRTGVHFAGTCARLPAGQSNHATGGSTMGNTTLRVQRSAIALAFALLAVGAASAAPATCRNTGSFEAWLAHFQTE